MKVKEQMSTERTERTERIIRKLKEIEAPLVRLFGIKKLSDEELLKLAKKVEGDKTK